MDQVVILGDKCTSHLKHMFQENSWNKVFLVTGKKSYLNCGAKSLIAKCLPQDAAVMRFSEFENNPNIKDLRQGLKAVSEFKPSVIISIGGGSVIDMGKLIRFYYANESKILSANCIPGKFKIPLVVLPTTAGTGSEATHFAVLYDEQKTKHSIANNAILADYVYIYPEFTNYQSQYLTACSGFDALSQAIEAYWNKNATKESDIFALKAIDLIYSTLPDILKHPTSDLRLKMAEGAYWSGKAINITKTTAPHAFSYPLTSLYGIPHGHAVAIVFAAIAAFNFASNTIPEHKLTRLRDLLKISESVRDTFKNYINSIGLSVPENEYKYDELVTGVNLERLSNNPASINIEEAKQLYIESLPNKC